MGDAVAVTLQYQCSPYYTNTALYPLLDQIERALKFERGEPVASKLDKVEAIVTANGRPLLDARLIATALTLPVEERYGPLNWMPQRQKEETLRALIDLIQAIATRQPTLLLFEDCELSRSFEQFERCLITMGRAT